MQDCVNKEEGLLFPTPLQFIDKLLIDMLNEYRYLICMRLCKKLFQNMNEVFLESWSDFRGKSATSEQYSLFCLSNKILTGIRLTVHIRFCLPMSTNRQSLNSETDVHVLACRLLVLGNPAVQPASRSISLLYIMKLLTQYLASNQFLLFVQLINFSWHQRFYLCHEKYSLEPLFCPKIQFSFLLMYIHETNCICNKYVNCRHILKLNQQTTPAFLSR